MRVWRRVEEARIKTALNELDAVRSLLRTSTRAGAVKAGWHLSDAQTALVGALQALGDGTDDGNN